MMSDDEGINSNEIPPTSEVDGGGGGVGETPDNMLQSQEIGGEGAAGTKAADSADDDLGKQLDDQTTLLDKQKKNIDAQTSLIEAQQKLAKAGLPAASVTAPVGDTTVSVGEAGYFANVAAYQAMQRCAEAVSKRINQANLGKDARIMLVDSLDFAGDDYTLALVKRRIDFYDRALQSQIELNTNILQAAFIPAEERGASGAVAIATLGTVLSIAPQILSGVAQAVSYFKVDYTVTKQQIDMKLSALQAEVAGQLTEHAQIFHFNLVDTETGLLKEYADLVTKRFDLRATQERLKTEMAERLQVELQDLSEQLAAAQTALTNTKGTEAEAQKQAEFRDIQKQQTSLSQQKTEVDSAIAFTSRLLDTFDGFITSITSTPEGQTQPQLVTAALRGYLRDANITHLLYLEIPSQGGEMVKKKGLFDLGGGVTYLGGSAVTFILAETSGKIVTGGMALEATEIYSKFGSGQATVKLIELKTG